MDISAKYLPNSKCKIIRTIPKQVPISSSCMQSQDNSQWVTKRTRISKEKQSSTATPGLNLAMNLLSSSSNSEQEEIIIVNNN